MFHRTHSEGNDLDETPPKPCPQMKGLLSALSDGTLTGIARWYAEHHVKDCPHCSATLTSLQLLRDRLRALGVTEPADDEALSSDQRASLEAALAEVDRKL